MVHRTAGPSACKLIGGYASIETGLLFPDALPLTLFPEGHALCGGNLEHCCRCVGDFWNCATSTLVFEMMEIVLNSVPWLS